MSSAGVLQSWIGWPSRQVDVGPGGIEKVRQGVSDYDDLVLEGRPRSISAKHRPNIHFFAARSTPVTASFE
jgi:hypothetical protein